jgi:hypothetical protein
MKHKQPDLPGLGGGAPYARGSDTSREAAESIEPSAGTLRRMVLDEIAKVGPHGHTCDEIEALLDLRHQTASARVYELHRAIPPLIVDSGRRRLTRSGRKAVVWIAANRGGNRGAGEETGEETGEPGRKA